MHIAHVYAQTEKSIVLATKIFKARQQFCLSVRPSVCLSVRNVPVKTDLHSFFFHLTVAQSF